MTVERWMQQRDRLVGVVENSTNDWLGTELASENIKGHVMSVVAFKSLPALEAALDRGEVDGAVLDDPVGTSLDGMQEVAGIKKLGAWSRYQDRLGAREGETFGIAVAADAGREADRPCNFSLNFLGRMLHRRELYDESKSIYCSVEEAIEKRYESGIKDLLWNNYDIHEGRTENVHPSVVP